MFEGMTYVSSTSAFALNNAALCSKLVRLARKSLGTSTPSVQTNKSFTSTSAFRACVDVGETFELCFSLALLSVCALPLLSFEDPCAGSLLVLDGVFCSFAEELVEVSDLLVSELSFESVAVRTRLPLAVNNKDVTDKGSNVGCVSGVGPEVDSI